MKENTRLLVLAGVHSKEDGALGANEVEGRDNFVKDSELKVKGLKVVLRRFLMLEPKWMFTMSLLPPLDAKLYFLSPLCFAWRITLVGSLSLAPPN